MINANLFVGLAQEVFLKHAPATLISFHDKISPSPVHYGENRGLMEKN